MVCCDGPATHISALGRTGAIVGDGDSLLPEIKELAMFISFIVKRSRIRMI